MGVAGFVVKKKISKSKRINDAASCVERLEQFLAWAHVTEPTEAEVLLAAEIEGLAQKNDISFDGGESLLLSILLLRKARLMFTGDKRAIQGLWPLAEHLKKQKEVEYKVVCFEQVLIAILEQIGAEELSRLVCREPGVDLTAAICCGCSSGGFNNEVTRDGLQSYIRDLSRKSGSLLYQSLVVSQEYSVGLS